MTPEQEARFDKILDEQFGTGKEPSELELLFSEPPLNRLGKRVVNEFLDKLACAQDWKAKQEIVRRFIVDIASQFEASDLLPWNEMSIAIKLHQKLIAKQESDIRMAFEAIGSLSQGNLLHISQAKADSSSFQEQIEQLRGELTGMAAQLNALELTVADMFPENYQEERVEM